MKVKKIAVVVTPIIMAVASSCAEPTRPTIARDQTILRLESEQPQTLDALLDAIARETPGFAGIVYRADQTPLVLVTRLADSARIVAALDRRLGAGGWRGMRVPMFRRMRYDFAALHGWHLSLRQHLLSADVVTTSVAEGRNTVQIGVSSEGSVEEVLATARGLGIPSDAVEVVVVERSQPRADMLQDPVRPVRGGSAVGVYWNTGANRGCTLGFTARVWWESYPLVATNAHCTETFGAVDSDTLFQYSNNRRDFVAVEAYDPSFTAQSGCRAGYTCRYSDVALFRVVTGGALLGEGSIFRTEYGTGPLNLGRTDPGSRDIAGYWSVAGRVDPSWMAAGQDVQKVGQTTGWTVGPIAGADPNFVMDGTCVNLSIDDVAKHELLCQYRAHFLSSIGDSGSPVFIPNSSDWSRASLAGLLWGGTPYVTDFTLVIDIERDFFEFTVEAP